MAKTFFNVSKWKRSPEIYRMLHPNAEWRYEQKPPPIIYGRVDRNTEIDESEIEIDVETED